MSACAGKQTRGAIAMPPEPHSGPVMATSPRTPEPPRDKCGYPFTADIRISDGNDKVLRANGEFWVNGERLGMGEWLTPSRYVVLVPRWGDRWWIGDLSSEGMLTTTVRSQSQIADARPDHLEPYTDPHARPNPGDIRINEGAHAKVITQDSHFIVDGKRLGTGRWVTSTRFVVFVAAWGDLWWVGELDRDGMLTATVHSDTEARQHHPQHRERWTHAGPFGRSTTMVISDGNLKQIAPNGDFVVNGEYLGRGQWTSPSRFVVFVERWGDRWWIGELVPGGMVTTTVEDPAQLASARPEHFEEYPFAQGCDEAEFPVPESMPPA